MAESTLSIQYDDIFKEVSYYLGYGRVGYSTLNASDAAKASDVDFCIQSGLRKFYNPPQIKRVVAQTESDGPILRSEARPHTWSFLLYPGSITLATGTAAYALSDDYGGELSELTSPNGTTKIPIAKEAQVRSTAAMNPLTGVPKYAAVRAKTAAGTAGQRFEVFLWPTPAAGQNGHVYSFRYKKIPNKIDTTNVYPEGGGVHGQTILAACLAVAEARSNDGGNGVKAAEYQALLESSIEVDLREQGQDVMIAPVDLAGAETTYDWLRYEIGEYMGWGGNTATWDTTQDVSALSILREGIELFRYPVDSYGRPHSWSFLRDETTVSLVDGTDTYDLPAAFGSPVGDVDLVIGTSWLARITWVSEASINAQRQARGTSNLQEGKPEVVCFRPKPSYTGAASQLQQIRVYPVPDASYSLHVRYYVAPEVLGTSAKYSRGGKLFGLTLLKAVLSAAEMKRDGRPGPQRALFQEEVQKAILRDRVAMAPSFVGQQAGFEYGDDTKLLQKQFFTMTSTINTDGIT